MTPHDCAYVESAAISAERMAEQLDNRNRALGVPAEWDSITKDLRQMATDLRSLCPADEPAPGHQEPERGTPPASYITWPDAVIEAMEVYGGGFVKAMANAYLRADGHNRRRILEVWDPLYGDQYREAAKHLRRRDRGGGPSAPSEDETMELPAGGGR